VDLHAVATLALVDKTFDAGVLLADLDHGEHLIGRLGALA
jgi:hypothetical protein